MQCPPPCNNSIIADGRSRQKTPMRIFLENGGMAALVLGKATQTSIAKEFGKTQGSVSRMIKEIKKAKKKRLQILAKI